MIIRAVHMCTTLICVRILQVLLRVRPLNSKNLFLKFSHIKVRHDPIGLNFVALSLLLHF